MLVTKIRVKLHSFKKTASRKKFNITKIPSMYAVEVKNRFKLLDSAEHIVARNSINHYWLACKKPEKKYKNSDETIKIAEQRKPVKASRQTGGSKENECRFLKSREEV